MTTQRQISRARRHAGKSLTTARCLPGSTLLRFLAAAAAAATLPLLCLGFLSLAAAFMATALPPSCCCATKAMAARSCSSAAAWSGLIQLKRRQWRSKWSQEEQCGAAAGATCEGSRGRSAGWKVAIISICFAALVSLIVLTSWFNYAGVITCD